MLNNRGLEYTEVDVSVDADALAFVKGLGYQAAPVVYTQRTVFDDLDMAEPRDIIEHWTQFQPDSIKAIIK